MDLDAFIGRAVGQVRNSKKKGKQGKNARKELGKSQKKLEETRQKIKEIAQKCERKQWKETKLIMLRVVAECKNCGKESPACIEEVYIETVHKTQGKCQKMIPEFEYAAYPELPREIVERPYKGYICADCFAGYNPKQQELEFEPKKQIKDPLEFLKGTKGYAKYQEESAYFDQIERTKILKSLLPQVPLLTYQPEEGTC